MGVKICRKCGEEKSLIDFYKDKGFKDGYKSTCKECENNRHKMICKHCGENFATSKKNQKYCSIKCLTESQKQRVMTKCCYCEKEYEVVKCNYNKNKFNYCSDKCRQNGHGSEILGENNGRYNSIKVQCEHCGKDIFRRESKIVERNFCGRKCYSEYRKIHYSKENHSCWNPNISDEERLNKRKCEEYYNWRDSVFERDNYTCQCCGEDTHNNNAHHLNGYNWDIDNRTNVDNGITLCYTCHSNFHKTYGYGSNTKEQFDEWIKNKLNFERDD